MRAYVDAAQLTQSRKPHLLRPLAAQLLPPPLAACDTAERLWIALASLRMAEDCRQMLATALAALTQLRRFEHFSTPKWLRLLRPTPIGRHYSGIGGTGPAVILGGGWAGRSSFSFVSKRLRSGSGSV